MCEHHVTEPRRPLGRRTALGFLGASLATALVACADPAGPSTAPPQAPGPAAPAVSAPAVSARPGRLRLPLLPDDGPTRRPRAPVIRDFTLPPVQNGLAPVLTKIETKQPVVFLTIDDGVAKSPEMIRLMAAYDYPASMFLTRNFVQDNPGFFEPFAAQGSLVENHTLSHNINMVTQMGYQQQLAEITGMQDYAQRVFGRRPALFRPPGGAYSISMRQAAAAAGIKAIVTWEAKANAGRMDYQYGNTLRPGDIVLMHFRPEFAADLAAFRAAQLAAGLEVVLLEDFLGVV
ncbi:polysaccharide deacetylase family protein [Pseudarthrobacter sp. PH31-O2]|nr:polysaccharide deacetylase family protein [Pseudarthrobacter sp. PH31-O2]